VNIEDVEGIGPEHAASLRAAGVATTEALLERGATAAGRAELVAATGINAKLMLEWVNHVDLMRIDGVGSEYSDLLEAAGVDSPAELAQRNAANLAQTFQELDAARPNWIRSVPSVTTVEGWIAQAKAMPKIVTHGGGGGEGAGGSGSTAEAATSESSAPMPDATPMAAEPEARPMAAEPEAPPMAASEPAPPSAEAPMAPAEPVAFAAPSEPAPPPPSVAPSAPMASPGGRTTDEGIWTRIKRFFGG
jgi:predicted flap endonuclease-1-like 5' DNA nuclease